MDKVSFKRLKNAVIEMSLVEAAAEARAATIVEVLAVVDESLDKLDSIISEYVESTLARNYLNDALSSARDRLAALSPTTPNEQSDE